MVSKFPKMLGCCFSSMGSMPPLMVAALYPIPHQVTGIREIDQAVGVQAFVPHSGVEVLVNLSWVGLPGAIKWCLTSWRELQQSIANPINSDPLSMQMLSGIPRV